jgi:hypothetical protein
MKPSVFEADKAEIETLLSKGYTRGEVFRIMQKKYPDRYRYLGYDNFAYFCQSRSLTQKIRKKCKSGTCDGCEYKRTVEPYLSGNRHNEILFCKLTYKQINPKVQQPFWCPKSIGGEEIYDGRNDTQRTCDKG